MWKKHQEQIGVIDVKIEEPLQKLTENKTTVKTSDKPKPIRHHQSGNMRKRIKGISCNETGWIFKEIVQGLMNSKKIAIGSFIRRIKMKRDAGIAIKAGARKLAEAYYNCLTEGTAYVEQGNEKYKEQIRQRERKTLQRLALKYNMQLIDIKIIA